MTKEKYPGSWPGNPNPHAFDYRCYELSNNLADFKKDRLFIGTIGNDVASYETALQFYNFIVTNRIDLLKKERLDRFLENDKVGNPKIYTIENIQISPGTLIFMKVLSDISGLKDVSTIIEIGSGYGGQCKIITEGLDVEYTCVDQPGCLALCKSYLREVGTTAKFMQSDSVQPTETDLVISNYCISELDVAGIDFYFDKIVKTAKYIYFAVGNYKHQSITHRHLIKKSEEYFNVEICPEDPQTSHHTNIIIRGNRK
jgi:cyclopropane fatty-acyl-phospholipid synthase-like methyltransferase